MAKKTDVDNATGNFKDKLVKFIIKEEDPNESGANKDEKLVNTSARPIHTEKDPENGEAMASADVDRTQTMESDIPPVKVSRKQLFLNLEQRIQSNFLADVDPTKQSSNWFSRIFRIWFVCSRPMREKKCQLD